MAIAGMDLKVARVRARVRQKDIAARIGRSVNMLVRYESQAAPDQAIARLYLAAVNEIVAERDSMKESQA